MEEYQGFLLSKQWRDGPRGTELEFWLATDAGPLKLRVPPQRSVFFLPNEQLERAEQLLSHLHGWQVEPVALRDFSLRPVSGLYFQSQRTLREARELLLANQLEPFESDIHPCDRFTMERYVRGAARLRGSARRAEGFREVVSDKFTASDYRPVLKVVSLDIETAMSGLNLYSIGLYAVEGGREIRRVLMVADGPVAEGVDCFPDQRALLIAFFDWLQNYDPDLIIGWNVVNFDMWYLEQLCRHYHIPFSLGRDRGTAHWRNLDDDGQRRLIQAPGRVVLDGIELLKSATYQFESFALNHVAGEVLGDAKLLQGDDRGDKITELFRSDKPALAAYNLQDCKLVWDIFERLKLLDFAIARSQMTGLALDRIGGSVAAFDYRYLPLLHRRGFVAPNGHLLEEIEHSPGGFVMDSRPGIYRHVLVLDFKSLYPSIIRSFHIDPLALAVGLNEQLDQSELVPGFKGAWFARRWAILPGLIEELWSLRDAAKQSNDKAQSQAIKILMNSFYGVLGAKGCRFFDARLASSITRRGHQIILQTAEQIERAGWSVIYGDTDSVFVWLEGVESNEEACSVGRSLETDLNRWWRDRLRAEYGVESALEIEFETHFQRFLMPTVRGSEQGSKKRYAGVVEDRSGEKRLVFKGLETVRTDWTPLAREFQAELYRRVFFDEPYRGYIRETVAAVSGGEMDERLIYRKRLRRRLSDYQRNIPPHVQAARKAAEAGAVIRRGDWIEYVMTVGGAEPVQLRRQSSSPTPVDYQHYIDRQLAPAADGILHFLGDSVAAICDQQMGLFS